MMSYPAILRSSVGIKSRQEVFANHGTTSTSKISRKQEVQRPVKVRRKLYNSICIILDQIRHMENWGFHVVGKLTFTLPLRQMNLCTQGA